MPKFVPLMAYLAGWLGHCVYAKYYDFGALLLFIKVSVFMGEGIA